MSTSGWVMTHHCSPLHFDTPLYPIWWSNYSTSDLSLSPSPSQENIRSLIALFSAHPGNVLHIRLEADPGPPPCIKGFNHLHTSHWSREFRLRICRKVLIILILQPHMKPSTQIQVKCYIPNACKICEISVKYHASFAFLFMPCLERERRLQRKVTGNPGATWWDK